MFISKGMAENPATVTNATSPGPAYMAASGIGPQKVVNSPGTSLTRLSHLIVSHPSHPNTPRPTPPRPTPLPFLTYPRLPTHTLATYLSRPHLPVSFSSHEGAPLHPGDLAPMHVSRETVECVVRQTLQT